MRVGVVGHRVGRVVSGRGRLSVIIPFWMMCRHRRIEEVHGARVCLERLILREEQCRRGGSSFGHLLRIRAYLGSTSTNKSRHSNLRPMADRLTAGNRAPAAQSSIRYRRRTFSLKVRGGSPAPADTAEGLVGSRHREKVRRRSSTQLKTGRRHVFPTPVSGHHRRSRARTSSTMEDADAFGRILKTLQARCPRTAGGVEPGVLGCCDALPRRALHGREREGASANRNSRASSACEARHVTPSS